MEMLNRVSLRRAGEPRVDPASSKPQLHAVSASPPGASSRTFVGSECLFINVITSKLSCFGFGKCQVKGKRQFLVNGSNSQQAEFLPS